MKTTTITEFVEIKVPETTTDEQFIESAEKFYGFLKRQDGYINGELVKALEGDKWRFVFHFENMEKVKAIGEKMRSSSEFNTFKSVIVPESIVVTFFCRIREW